MLNKEKLLAFFALLTTALLAYQNCLHINIPTDSYPLLYTFQKYGAAGLLHNFYDVGMAPFADSIIFIGYKIVGVNNTAWIILSLFLHTLNAYLVFLFGLSLLKGLSVKYAFQLSLVSAFLFLLSPFQTEIVLWAPRMFNYLIATSCFLAACYYSSEYLFWKNKSSLFGLHLFFVLAILSFESPLIFPGVIFCLFFLLRISSPKLISIEQYFKLILLPQLLIIGCYFIACKLWLGGWIVHYGAETHLAFSFPLLLGNLIKYLSKFLLFYRYLPEARGEWLQNLNFDIGNSGHVYIALVVIITTVLTVLYFQFKKSPSLTLLTFALFVSFVVSLLPVINLETSFVGVVMSDRYGYLPSTMIYLFIPISLFLILKTAGKILAFALVPLSFFLLLQTIPLWTQSQTYSDKLIENYKPHLNTQRTTYVLNMPDNYNWILSFRGGFEEYLALKYNHKPASRIITIANFFVSSNTDSIRVVQKSPREFEISSADGNPRFLHEGTWAKSYETNEYKVEFAPDFSSYTLTFKIDLAHVKILQVAGANWKELRILNSY